MGIGGFFFFQHVGNTQGANVIFISFVPTKTAYMEFLFDGHQSKQSQGVVEPEKAWMVEASGRGGC